MAEAEDGDSLSVDSDADDGVICLPATTPMMSLGRACIVDLAKSLDQPSGPVSKNWEDLSGQAWLFYGTSKQKKRGGGGRENEEVW